MEITNPMVNTHRTGCCRTPLGNSKAFIGLGLANVMRHEVHANRQKGNRKLV